MQPFRQSKRLRDLVGRDNITAPNFQLVFSKLSISIKATFWLRKKYSKIPASFFGKNWALLVIF